MDRAHEGGWTLIIVPSLAPPGIEASSPSAVSLVRAKTLAQNQAERARRGGFTCRRAGRHPKVGHLVPPFRRHATAPIPPAVVNLDILSRFIPGQPHPLRNMVRALLHR
jgi:hypothetical protein